MTMKRIVCILSAVLFSVGLVSCGWDFWGDDAKDGAKNTYYVEVEYKLYIHNKSSQAVDIRWPWVGIPKDSIVLFDHGSMDSWSKWNPRDSIKKDKYALLKLDNYDICVYDYDANKNEYNTIQIWSPNDNKKHSIFNKENWELTILRDTMYFDKRGNGYPETRFTFYYPGYYGWFECAYTYTLTDEALKEE